MGELWANSGRVAVNFTALPPAANNNGLVVRCNPLVAGQGYLTLISDGTYWRPHGGRQTLYVLAAAINMAVNADPQKLISIPIPPLLIPDGRTNLRVVIGADKLLGTADTATFSQRMGPLDTAADPTLFSTTLATTSISVGSTNEANRVSSTTVRKHGSGGSAVSNALSAGSTATRAAAITVGDLGTTTNYLNVWGQMTTGATEYGQVHAYIVELFG